ncbi:MAG: hypothetical protein M0Z47_12350 [Actinomycetota bacterium]|nr:hypothetical protein [Actinomycetota bacterium]
MEASGPLVIVVLAANATPARVGVAFGRATSKGHPNHRPEVVPNAAAAAGGFPGGSGYA